MINDVKRRRSAVRRVILAVALAGSAVAVPSLISAPATASTCAVKPADSDIRGFIGPGRNPVHGQGGGAAN